MLPWIQKQQSLGLVVRSAVIFLHSFSKIARQPKLPCVECMHAQSKDVVNLLLWFEFAQGRSWLNQKGCLPSSWIQPCDRESNQDYNVLHKKLKVLTQLIAELRSSKISLWAVWTHSQHKEKWSTIIAPQDVKKLLEIQIEVYNVTSCKDDALRMVFKYICSCFSDAYNCISSFYKGYGRANLLYYSNKGIGKFLQAFWWQL